MNTHFPSIQSFYQREVAQSTAVESAESHAGDGFTSSEVSATLHPLALPWVPSRQYEKSHILLLQAGARNYEITGRIVNFSATARRRTQCEASTGGQWLLVVSDGTGAIAVKLHCGKVLENCLSLGQRVTVYATYIAYSTKAETGYIPFVTCTTNIYPGHDGATHIIFHQDLPSSDDDQLWRTPLGLNLRQGGSLSGLMTLKSFLTSGYDMGDGSILVCVRSIGSRKTVRPRKREGTVDLVEIGIFDDTASTTLKLWGDLVFSAESFVPKQTILLISSPSCRGLDRSTGNPPSPDVGVGYSSLVYVEPSFAEADWLRKKVRDISKKESIMIFPEGIFDVEASINGPVRELFTLAEIDELARQDLNRNFTGKLNVIIVEMNLMENWSKDSTCCFECCGIPQYANKPLMLCKNCGLQRELILNPRIIGTLVDESGSISSGKLVWKESAWTQLFFGGSEKTETDGDDDDATIFGDQSWEDLTALDNNSLRDIEDQMLYSRVTLTFGWASTLARLCILGIEW